MKRHHLEDDHYQLSFEEHEAYFLINTLLQLSHHYDLAREDLAPGVKEYWEGTVVSLTEESTPEGAELAEALQEARQELRSERSGLVQNWLRDFEIAEKRNPWVVDLTQAQLTDFVAILNDRRMTLALEYGIGEREMENWFDEMILSEKRRAVLFEIDIIGQFIGRAIGEQF